MTMHSHKIASLSTLLILTIVFFAGISQGQEANPVRLIRTIPVPNIKGRIDHMASDAPGKRLFVAALGNNSVEAIDLGEGKSIKSIQGLKEPQGVLVIPELNLLLVANGGDGVLNIYNSESLAPVMAIRFSGDADNIRYDQAAGRVYVGYGEGAIGIVDAKSLRRIGDIALLGHPESFQLETKGQRIFVNVPTAGKIVVLDRTKQSAIGEWPVEGSCSNFPMALDEEGKHLLVACRHPAKIIMYDTDTGKKVSSFPIADDADDLYFDAARKLVYVSCGAGVLQVFRQAPDGAYSLSQEIPTGTRARTSLFSPEQSRLYVAVPRSGRKSAEIQVFSVQ